MTTADRIKTTFRGLFATAFVLVLIGGGFVFLIKSFQIASYLPVTARVKSIKDSRDISVIFTYIVDGKEYTQKESASKKKPNSITYLHQYKVGQEVTLFYDPTNPEYYFWTNVPNAIGFFYIILGVPFLWGSINILWFGLTGKGFVPLKRPSPRSDLGPEGIVMFAGMGFICAFLQVLCCISVPWPWNLVTGLTILFIVLPGTSLLGHSLFKSWKLAKIKKMRELRDFFEE